MTHHFIMMSPLRIKILKLTNLVIFLCDIDYNSRTDVFRDVISLIINQCDPRPPQSVRKPRSANKRSALVDIKLKIQYSTKWCFPSFQYLIDIATELDTMTWSPLEVC